MNTAELHQFPVERRVATILFADLSGFTALAERLDFETVSYLINEIWLRLDKVILDHRGYIDKHLGDGIMAVWGAPNTQEDDVEQAVLAALGLHEALAKFAMQAKEASARGLKLRVGISTGPVLATYIGVKNEYTVMGDTVNVASRLEQAAVPGEVWATPVTYRAIRGMFKMKRLRPIQVKGKTEPIAPYVIERKLAQPSRVRYRDAGGLETHMVGRDNELETLKKIFQKTISSKKPELGLIIGELGIGKSRLMLEFANKVEAGELDGSTLMSVRGLAQAEQSPFFFWRSLWKNRFSISDDLDPEIAKEKFIQGIKLLWGRRLGNFSSLEAAHLIGDLIGISWDDSPFLQKFEDHPSARSERAFELTREVLIRLCETSPVILMFDDLQWADKGSLHLLEYLLQPVERDFPLLVLGSARPEFFRRQVHWQNMGEVVNLNPLPLTVEMVKEAYPFLIPFHKNMIASLVERSEGNPYFLEEMVKSLAHGATEDSDSDIESTWDNFKRRLPNNLQMLLQARLDSLPPDVRSIALIASVAGRVFWEGSILAAARIMPGTGLLNMSTEVLERVIQNALRQLVRLEMAFPRTDSVFAGEREYIFKHSLLRDVAYDLTPIRYRQYAHLAVAKWLGDRAGPDLKGMVASHYVNGGDRYNAIKYYQAASEYAFRRGAEAEAHSFLEKIDELREE